MDTGIFGWIKDQYGSKIAEHLSRAPGTGNRKDRRAEEAWKRRHYFSEIGRKKRNIIRRKSQASQ